MNNQKYGVRPVIMNINSNETLFYPYSILVNKCSGSSNDINDFYAKLCFPDVVKNMNIKVINQVSRTNEARYLSWYETCSLKCRFDASVEKCRYEWQELVNVTQINVMMDIFGSLVLVNVDVINHVILDYENRKCRKKLIEECSENIDGNEMVFNATLNDYGKVCNSCTKYIVLLVVFFIISISISSAFFYFHLHLKKGNTYVNTTINTITYAYINTGTVIYETH